MKKVSQWLILLPFIFASCSQNMRSSSYKSDENAMPYPPMTKSEELNTEEYDHIQENGFQEVLTQPLSTFSIDVDAASYSNVRRFITDGHLPPKDAVRIEEFINYFTYDYPQPKESATFSINTEVGACPWNKEHKLVHIGLQGKKMDSQKTVPSNLVFLMDVSGSMEAPNKLPLLKKSFKMLLNKLSNKDRISIVVYAGAAGVVLPSTSCNKKDKIIEAVNQLSAGGSTAGGEGIKLAYRIAEKNFIKNGNNRILIATDGDFNVGVSSDNALIKLIEEKRETGVFLSVLGFGTGNYKDSKMEKIADHGNGNYYYIDNLFEAKKVLVNEIGSTLHTIAKDVKIQIEFNPAKVAQYRLVGYENRLLENKDFDDDTKDAGELGAGHSVTALYEIIPRKKGDSPKSTYRYQSAQITEEAYKSLEIANVKFRYKPPKEDKSKLIEEPIVDRNTHFEETSTNYRFSASVATFGMLLRDSEYKNDVSYSQVIAMAEESKGDDTEGYRSEFIRLVKLAQEIQN